MLGLIEYEVEMGGVYRYDKKTIERAARVYGSNQEAAAALGIQPGSFGRLCRRYEVPTPQQRRRRSRRLQGLQD